MQEINSDIVYRLVYAAPRSSYGISHYDSDNITLKNKARAI
jgi:hypothetical protein